MCLTFRALCGITQRLTVLGLLLTLLNGCASSSPALSIEEISALGGPKGFVPLLFDTGEFQLMGMLRNQGGHSDTLIVYLEGDGRSISNGKPTPDPTPATAFAYRMALDDPAPKVLYLARIGQFHDKYDGMENAALWSDERLGEAAVHAADQAVSQAKDITGSSKVHLLGYSGGGGLAALVAERRNDLLSLVTVAGLLDTEWWTENGHYRPLTGLNPANDASRINALPQIHFYGEDDTTVPSGVSENFARQAAFSNLRRISVPGDHKSEWLVHWPQLLRDYVLPLRLATTPVAPKPVIAAPVAPAPRIIPKNNDTEESDDWVK